MERLESLRRKSEEKVDVLTPIEGMFDHGEGVDLEAIIDLDEFVEIKESMEDAIADELIRRINAARPEWDLSFLTKGGVDPKASEVDRSDGTAGEKRAEVDPWRQDRGWYGVGRWGGVSVIILGNLNL